MIGKTLSHYKVLEKIGQGGMGEVYLAQDTTLDRKVALKFLTEEMQQDSTARKRFLREAKSAAALDHPFICHIHEVGEAEGKSFISMEYVQGETLKDKLAKGPLPLNDALEKATEIIEALEAAHNRKIVHRDLKPSNIMLTPEGHVKVMDFGLAKRVAPAEGQEEEVTTALTREGQTLGTVPYMSPEQIRGQEVDTRSDIFSFGVVLFEMLAGVNPFAKGSLMDTATAILTETVPPLTRYTDDLPVLLQHTVKKMLAKEPNERYQSVHEVGTQISQLLAERSHFSTFGFKNLLQGVRKPQIAVPGVIIVFLVSFIAVWLLNRTANIRWAKEQAIPEVVELIDEGRFWQAFTLAQEVERYIPTDGSLVSLWPRMSGSVSVNTTPSGANIYVKAYVGIDGDWKLLGSSPMDGVQIPLGLSHLRIEKAGYETVQGALNPLVHREVEIHLDEEGSLPPGMVRVVGGDSPVGMLDDFFIDKYEVTNKQFKEFIDNGGYQKQEYWKQEFVNDGRVLTWEEAMAEFRDSTDRPGPSTWEAGDYPDGHDDYPVNGVSWYEAAAYAEFVGKSLPTSFHWDRAAGANVGFFGSPILRLSNFGDDGPAAVGSHQGLNQYGTYDMAGNVREWCWNKSQVGRLIRGGAWNDAHYMFRNVSHQSPFNRSPKNGFRCVRYLDRDKIPETVFQPVDYRAPRDYSQEKPVSDDVFQVYKNQFSFDPIELNPKIEWADESTEDWTTEKITFNAAYEKERMTAYLFLPKGAPPPYQTVIFFPGGNTLSRTSITVEQNFGYVDFIVKGGRAVMYPVYKGTHERSVTDFPRDRTTHRYTEYVIKWVQDFQRSIEYLETRPEININQLAYWGDSLGGQMGAIIPAVEERLKVSILFRAGFTRVVSLSSPNSLFIGQARAEVDPINFVTRVTIPTLMLNGKYDNTFPLETNIMPMYDLLGTPKEDKHIVLYETDHFVPRKEGIKESLAWLDRYLGPVR